MPLDPNIILSQKLASPVSAMQQGQQFAQQQQIGAQKNRLAELQIQDAENKLNAPPKLDAQQAKMLATMATNAVADTDALPEEQRADFWENSVKPHLMQAAQGVGLNVPMDKFDYGTVKMFAEKAGGKEMSAEVQSSRMLPGGLVQLTLKNGTVKTVTPSEADAMAVRSAEDRGSQLQGDRSSSRERGKGSAKIGLEAYKDMGTARKNMNTLNEAISLIDQGAETGVIQSKFPSFRAASIKLDNVKNRLGLDVIGSVTFGALSEAELNMALSTALPTNLEPAELRKWLVEKRDAQSKLADVLEEAAQFLNTDGNDIGDWMREKGVKSGARQQVESKTGSSQPTVSNW
jgi:hypothetical protein